MKFAKYQGAGNDFILIDDRAEQFPLGRELIQRLCHRRFGVGADGLILLQNHPHADMRMRIFNSDGSEAEGCGNGVRCLVQFCSDYALRCARIAVGDRILSAYIANEEVNIEMGEMRDLRFHLSLCGQQVHFVNSGVPHIVVFVPDLQTVDLESLAPQIRFHPELAPCGANVNFAMPCSDGVGIRTYERGVEAETLACGTGAVAVAVLGAKLFDWKSPVLIKAAGGDLRVFFDLEFKKVSLSGRAQKVFCGEI